MMTDEIYNRPVEILQTLLRFDTTNPPGNETECVGYIDSLLQEAGIETTILAQEPGRPNLLARLPGQGQAPPLLLQGHVDVVTTAGQTWQQPPFAGVIAGEHLWGRGAMDMKGGVAMMVAAFLRAKAAAAALPGDVILCILADEENRGTLGAKYLVEAHPEQFAGVRYALGEVGGVRQRIGGAPFYPIMIAEKQLCWLRLRLQGPGGHASRPPRNATMAMAQLGQLLTTLTEQRLPVRITPPVRAMIEAVVAALGPTPAGRRLADLLDPAQTDAVLDELGPAAAIFEALLHNTVCPTIVHGGSKVNVIPSEIEVELDGRLLPGLEPADLLAELAELVGPAFEFEVAHHDPGPAGKELGLFPVLADILRGLDASAAPIPYVLAGVTDARFFARLGIQTFGFTPMNLPLDTNYSATVHAADERVPLAAMPFGAEAMYQALLRFGEVGG